MKSQHIVEQQLGQVGLEYVRRQLSKGGPLAEQHLGHLDKGFVWEFVPADSSGLLRKEDLGQGGRYDAAEAAAITREYAIFFRGFLEQGSSCVLLFENQLFRMNDPCMLDKEALFEWKGATYFYFPGKGVQVSELAIEATLPQASRYPGIILATRVTFDQDLPSRGALTSDHASAIAEQVQHVLVGAYDEEGYVMWSRGAGKGAGLR